ncbi:hypothetical protein BH23GEM6_BH23GEM6_22070 [soil metagenome]
MYSSCIFCSGYLGRNETLESFPVGSVLAFDSWKGRLWAVCPSCGRWNLAPIEERWEAVGRAEQEFRDTRLRVQSENIGLAYLPEGTRLVRVGDARPGEMAAWRYGRELRDRRSQHRVKQIVRLAAGVVMLEAVLIMVIKRQRQVVFRLHGHESSLERPLLVKEKSLRGARVQFDTSGEPQILLRGLFAPHQRVKGWVAGAPLPDEVVLTGNSARDLLCRAMVRVNAPGASKADLRGALTLMADSSSPSRLLDQVAGGDFTFIERPWTVTKPLVAQSSSGSGRLPLPAMLALEMSLHEQDERIAVEGELEALKERWREAEEIAAIADTLPDDPLNLPGNADRR